MKHIEIIIGGRYDVVDDQGTRHSVEVLRDNGNGTLMVRVDAADEPQPMVKAQLEELLSNSPSDGAYAVHSGKIAKDELSKGKNSSNKKELNDISKDNRKTTKKGITREGIIGCLSWLLILGLPVLIGWSISYCSKRDVKQPKQTIKSKTKSTSTQPDREIEQFVITSADDSVFHYSTACSQLGISPYLSNEYIERKVGKWMCRECGIKEAEFLIHKEEYLNDLRELDSIH